MVMLVSLEQASEHLRRDTTDDDNDLTLKIHAASRSVLNYLKAPQSFLGTDGEPDIDTSGNLIVPEEIQQATLLLIGYFYKARDNNPDGDFKQGYLPAVVTALLYPLRDPALA